MKRIYEDDDQRTIADMSHLPDVSAFGRWTGRHPDGRRSGNAHGSTAAEQGKTSSRYPAPEMDREERRMYILGIMKASLGIGLIYLAAFALLVAGLLFIWGKF